METLNKRGCEIREKREARGVVYCRCDNSHLPKTTSERQAIKTPTEDVAHAA